jgi:superfamily I DNA and/or RNA helicase
LRKSITEVDIILVDEAAQSLEAELAITLAYQPKHMILVNR